MNNHKSHSLAVALGAIVMANFVYADSPMITGVTARQRYPWNGMVDISYTVTGDIADEAKHRAVVTALKVVAIDVEANTTNTATQLSGDLSLEAGTHTVAWDMAAEGFPLPFKSSNMVFKVACEATPAMYCVIDLSGGANVTTYPIAYLTEPPSGGFNMDEYKTTKLVLRRVEPGPIPARDAAVTKPYYIGIFEFTQRQYELVMDVNPCSSSSHGKGDCYPVHLVSYDMIRGPSRGAEWPGSSEVDATSFMGKLRVKTEMPELDLPTVAQWEYACRAGTTTSYSYGNSADGNYMWYRGNTSASSEVVGSRFPNTWGLYDMHGNVWEWCLDWAGESLVGDDPVGPSSGVRRRLCGGSWNGDASWCRTVSGSDCAPSSVGNADVGFRVVKTIPTAESEQSIVVMCFGESVTEEIDIESTVRATAKTERIRYSSEWVSGAGADALAVVAVNGETLNSAAGSGYVDWLPMSNGTYTLTHKVMSGNEQIGDVLTVMFVVDGIVTSTQTTVVPVPFVWLRQYVPGVADNYDAYETAANASAANGRKVWECYAVGLDPANVEADLRITNFPMKADGTPDFDEIMISPPQTQWNVQGATPVLMGKATLESAGEWQPVTEENKAGMRFFKVEVVLP